MRPCYHCERWQRVAQIQCRAMVARARTPRAPKPCCFSTLRPSRQPSHFPQRTSQQRTPVLQTARWCLGMGRERRGDVSIMTPAPCATVERSTVLYSRPLSGRVALSLPSPLHLFLSLVPQTIRRSSNPTKDDARPFSPHRVSHARPRRRTASSGRARMP